MSSHQYCDHADHRKNHQVEPRQSEEQNQPGEVVSGDGSIDNEQCGDADEKAGGQNNGEYAGGAGDFSEHVTGPADLTREHQSACPVAFVIDDAQVSNNEGKQCADEGDVDDHV